MTEHVDTIVVGAGVIGLSIARALALAGAEVIVLEAARAFGTGISSRNSEVIHAGIYYPKDSLKARLCVRGKRLPYEYCASRGVGHKRLGKLIVATQSSQTATLAAIRTTAARNGVDDLEWLDGPQVRALEPELDAAAALLSPSSGIVDSHGLMMALLGDAEAAGAQLVLASPLVGGRVGGKIVLEVGGPDPMTVSCARLVNTAGLDAQNVARALEGLAPDTVPPSYLAKGSYFTLAGPSPFAHLVYPVPVPGGLGTHSSLDMGGHTKFGPDVEWVESRDYAVDPGRAPAFAEAIRRYWPGLPEGALQPGMAGLRPKLSGPDGGKWGSDFVIQGPADHGIAGLVNLYGIDSPGLTSSLAIAEHVANLLAK